MKNKFEQVFKDTEEKIEGNEIIDFDKSSVNNNPTQEKVEKPKRTARIQIYLTEQEELDFLQTMKLKEKQTERIVALIQEDIKKRLNKP